MSEFRHPLATLAMVAAVLFAALAWTSAALSPAKPHLSGAQCRECHLDPNPTSPENARKLVASQEVLCARCHAAAIKFSHPSGFPVRRTLHKDYPLDWKGDLTCASCHQVHGTEAGLMRGARRSRQLCESCHDREFFVRMRDGGESLAGVAHLSQGLPAAGGLDPYSLQCMSCHGGKGEAPGALIDARGVVRHGSGRANHPVGVSYAKAVRYGGYRAEVAVERLVPLPEGRVGCVSCHVGYSKDHGKLTAPRAGSQLCFVCHDL